MLSISRLVAGYVSVALCGVGLFAPAFAASEAVCADTLATPIEWSRAVERLVRCNADVRLALVQLDSARAERTIAGQIPNPQASFGAASINPQKGVKGGNQQYQIDWLARIDQLIERGGKRELRISQAESGLLASRWQSADTMRTALLALSHAWSELWAAQDRELLLDTALIDFRRIEEVSRLRYNAGDIAQADLSRVVIDLQRIENDREQARAERLRAQQVLAFVLMLPPDSAEIRLSSPWPALQGTFPEPDAMVIRPEIAAAEALVEKTRSARELARTLGTRDVVVGVQADRYPAPAGDGNTFGLYASVPLFTWHRYEGELAKSESDYTAALLTRQRLENQTKTRQVQLLQEREVSLGRWRRLRDNALPLGDRVSASIRLAYEQRAISLLDMLDALRVHRLLQIDTLEARLQYEKSDALARALLRISPQANDPVFRFVGIPEINQ
ncbi:MAG: TolC family protein [Burkholderiaceae bacterium]|nr:TolC family protein [Burkholderiaceae bacterium]